MKYLSLILLVAQNSSLVLLMRQSRIVSSSAQGPLYISSTAVVAAELLKLFTCLAIIAVQERSLAGCISVVRREVIGNWRETLLMCVPSGLYTVQNNLLYVAVSNLEAATYQVTYQLKILTTALFSVVMLEKRLSLIRWLSLLILGLGVALVQLNPTSLSVAGATSNAAGARAANAVGPEANAHLGLAAVLLACISSGYAGVYFEKKLKGSAQSVWVRNVQLGLFGTLIGLFGVYSSDGAAVRAHGFFHGYNALVWAVVANNALGGLLVAVVIKYADNILKGFATSISIVISSIASVFLFTFRPGQLWLFGATMVLSSTYMYSAYDDTNVPRTVLPMQQDTMRRIPHT